MRIVLFFLLLLPATAIAHLRCTSSWVLKFEKNEIPKVLGIGSTAAHITHIHVIAPGPKIPPAQLDCYVTVHWSNGLIQPAEEFMITVNPYGQRIAVYGRNLFQGRPPP